MTTDELRAQAASLQSNIAADIVNAQTRVEHIRLTQLAEEAQRLVQSIDQFAGSETSAPHGLPTHF